MKFAHFFIDRPVFALVLSIVIVIVGTISIYTLPIAQYPEIVPPTVIVTAHYPGANARVVADTVATPIEQQVNGVEKMLYMTSQCTNNGDMSITVTFAVGTNLDIAQVQVQNRVALAEPQLPEDVRRLGVSVRKSSPDLTLAVGLFASDGSRDTLYISNFANLQIRDELARLPGVGDITVFGARDYSMRLWLDPEQLAARGMTAGDVADAVREQNIQVAAGIVGGPPQPAETAKFQYTVSTLGRLTDPEQFAEIVVKTGADGRITRVRDVARVELGAADYNSAFSFDGKPAVGLGVYQLPGSNSIKTADAIYARMAELKKSFPPGIDYTIPYDSTIFVRNSLQDVVRTLFEAVGLVVIVVLVFLQGWRASLIPLLAIPVSLIGTFAVMAAFGFSINNLSLFGIVLAVGIVVDDAIVVVENIERWIEHGLPPREAAHKAMTEVTAAVIAIAFGLSAVFIPVAFVSGITGQFYRQFALTISFATLISALNSLTLSPAMAALLLTSRTGKQDWFARLINLLLGWFFRLFNWGLSGATHAYAGTVKRVVRFSAITLLVYVGMIVLTYFQFARVPTGFIPQQDTGYLIVSLQMPDAAAITRTEKVMHRLADIASKVPGVGHTVAISGFSILNGVNQSNAGTMFLPLQQFTKRVEHTEQTGPNLARQLMGLYSQVQEGLALVLSPPPVRGLGSAGGFKLHVQDRSGNATPQELQAAVDALVARANADPRLSTIFTTYRANVPQLYAEVNREKVKKQGVPVTGVFEALQVYLGSLYINDFNYLGRTFHVTAQADAPFRANASTVGQLKARNRSGGMVPLGAVLDLQDITGPERVSRFNLYRAAEINGSAAPGYSSGQATAAMEELAAATLPPGYSIEWTELAYQEKAAGNTALLIFPLCVLFVWLVHSAEYESFALSTAIILIVPLCLLSGITGVWLRAMDNNIFTQIGLIVLAGLSAKNAVLIVEFAKQHEEQGKQPFDAAVEAARLRLRPILMTSFAFILGVVPLVLAKGAGAEMRQALGTVVFFGMVGVTLFGIFFTPVFYVVIRRLLPRREHAKHEPASAPTATSAR